MYGANDSVESDSSSGLPPSGTVTAGFLLMPQMLESTMASTNTVTATPFFSKNFMRISFRGAF